MIIWLQRPKDGLVNKQMEEVEMEANEFLEKMVDILDTEEELTMETELSSLEEWDSLGILTFLAEMEPNAKASIKADAVKKAGTIADLHALLG